MKTHPKFADWYRTAALEPSEGVPEKRTLGFDSLWKSPDINLFLDIVRLFFDRRRYSDSSDDQFHRHFLDHDSTFGKFKNEHELRVLAGMAIGVGVEKSDQFQDTLALAVSCMSFQGENTDVPVLDIIEETEKYLDRRAKALRERPPFQRVSVSKLQIDEHLEMLRKIPANQASAAAEPLQKIAETLVEKCTHMMKNVSDAFQRYQNVIAAQDEELNIMWWVVGGFSCYDKSRLADLSLPEASLRAAFELARLTKLPIGPIASLAYLDNVLRAVDSECDKSILSIFKTVDGTGAKWKQAILTGPLSDCRDWISRASDFVPITFALFRSSDGGDQWSSGFEKTTGVKAERELKPLKISHQFYMELLLLRLLTEGDKAS